MSRLRAPRQLRGTRQAIEDRDFVPGRTDVLEDEPHRQALDQLLPQIAAESEQASKVARTTFFYYRKKRTGRRCSCAEIHTSPAADCQICFGSGRSGGWDLHGCQSEWIDVTSENLRLVNVLADYAAGVRPVLFSLEAGTVEGFIETEIDILRNVRKVQALQFAVGGRVRNNNAKMFIKASTDLVWVALDEESLKARLQTGKLGIRIELSRQTTETRSPLVSHLMIRYCLIPEVRMYADINLAESSFELGDLGFTDSYSTLSLYISKAFDYINAEDFLIRETDQKRFKVTRFERNAVSEILLSHRVMARLLVPGQDPLIRFP